MNDRDLLETITRAYLLLIHERRLLGRPPLTFEAFSRANPDLLAWKPSVLEALYRPETLGSELARRTFLLPDRPQCALPGVASAGEVP